MYLKRLEVQGFKSFPDKVRFEFIRGITAVVGPNGSGKSNISDAIRWVLGEQSAKSLRGAKMEDVIFSGTANRKALGFAEVSLTLDNSDGALIIDYSEVTVSRRVFRSGDSEYQINGTFCRLKDIHELLMDTGIGKEGYSLIGQGRIDEILSSRPEERRYIFEEAAGIVKFKSRKSEAEARLEKEKQNLLRVNDIITELEAQLEPLYMKSEKAKKYLELKENLKILQINIFLNEANKADSENKSYAESLLVLNKQIESHTESIERIKAETQSLKADIKQNMENIKNDNNNLVDSRLLQEQKESEVKLNEQQIAHMKSDIERLLSEIQQKQKLIQNKRDDLSFEEEKKNRLDTEYAQASAIISEHEEHFKLINERMIRDEQRVNDFNRTIIELINASTEIKSDNQKMNSDYERLEERKEQLQEELHLCETSQDEKSRKISALRKLSENVLSDLGKLETEQKTLISDRAKYSSLYQGKKDEYKSLRQTLTELNARHKILSDLENDYEGYNRSVKSVFSQKAKEPTLFSGIYGTVGELLDVPNKYETAIETALGFTVQNIIVDDEDAAKLAIEHLKQTNAGRATFLPLSAVKPRGIMDSRIVKEKGCLGIASDLVRFDSKFINVFLSLLGRVAVVDNMDNAVRIFKKYNYELRIVTIEGELLNPGGAITGGSSNKKNSGIFGRSREIKELNQSIEALNIKDKQMSAELDKLSRTLGILNERIEQNNGAIRTMNTEAASNSREIAQISAQLSELELRIAGFKTEDTRIMEQLIDTNSRIRMNNEKSREYDNKLLDERIKLENFQNSMISERETKDIKMNELMSLKSTAGALEQSIKSTQENISRIMSEIKLFNTEIRDLQTGISDNDLRIRHKESEINIIVDEIASISEDQDTLRGRLDRLNQAALDLDALLQVKEGKERDLLDELSRLNSDIVRVETKKEQLENDIRKLYDAMWDDYKITYIAAKDYPSLDMSPTALNRDERRVKNEINGLGDVNVSAIEEYKNVKSRFDFLVTQRNDIVAAEEKLELVIKELVEQMEAQFMEQFARISENFGIVYKEMFGGGQAYLKLSDQSSILSSGIEIVSRPPGKNISNISLLSGGEHALTAIALLFGILRLKPSPFCLLDEIEASLDDANVARFANYLKKFAGESQFIVITHRKGTMEAADVLYGITMQEQGISKPVSVKFAS